LAHTGEVEDGQQQEQLTGDAAPELLQESQAATAVAEMPGWRRRGGTRWNGGGNVPGEDEGELR